MQAGLLLLLILTGCDTRQQEDFLSAALRPPEGFTRTDENGQVLSVDPDDWRVAPAYRGYLRFDPAYPNPFSGGEVRLPFYVFSSLSGGLSLWANDVEGRPRLLDEHPSLTQPGAYVFTFDPAVLTPDRNLARLEGLHRLYVYRGTDLVSYGDLMIQVP
ncbi:hypothetical protein SAMN04488087_2445 [Rhodothermus profundi]|uniref:Uncharacterized protein n=1 Tax=Rhodothermus profundi TaxID=633813 RepID=A0A1M6WV47_9BACT|nr:hypothetical protein SAMN04488087_2445 [Rhodothermus profundi]